MPKTLPNSSFTVSHTLVKTVSIQNLAFKGHFEKSKPERHIFIDGNVHAMACRVMSKVTV